MVLLVRPHPNSGIAQPPGTSWNWTALPLTAPALSGLAHRFEANVPPPILWKQKPAALASLIKASGGFTWSTRSLRVACAPEYPALLGYILGLCVLLPIRKSQQGP